MLIEQATENNILSLLVGRNIMLPWRCQSDLNIVVPFEEYQSFIKQMTEHEVCYLPGSIEVYRKALQKGNEVLLHRLYLRDLSASVYNEVGLSSNYGKDATLISTGYEEECSQMTLPEMLNKLNEFDSGSVQQAVSKLTSQCFDCRLTVSRLSNWNLALYYYSVYLRVLTTANPNKEVLIMEGE